jgi:hypothetical protein
MHKYWGRTAVWTVAEEGVVGKEEHLVVQLAVHQASAARVSMFVVNGNRGCAGLVEWQWGRERDELQRVDRGGVGRRGLV